MRVSEALSGTEGRMRAVRRCGRGALGEGEECGGVSEFEKEIKRDGRE